MRREVSVALLVGAGLLLSGVDGSSGNSANCSSAAARPDSLEGTNVAVYFGCGCFWHMQNAFATCAEEGILGRSGQKLTTFTGYAGSTAVGAGGKVCYHNGGDVADYGSLGHAEAVSLDLTPEAAERIFQFFLLSTCVNGVRRDTQDWGSEYRSLVGFPGGLAGELGQLFATVAANYSVQVAAGQGQDPDKHGTVWVMDTAEFPFHQAEIYHQFHDDMIDSYGSAYHQLKQGYVERGILKATGCPYDEAATLYQ